MTYLEGARIVGTNILEDDVREIAISALGHFFAEIDSSINLYGDYDWSKADYLRHDIEKKMLQQIKYAFERYDNYVEVYY